MTLMLKDLIEKFLDWTATFRAAGTAAVYRRHLERFLAHVGDQACNALKAYHLLSWGRTWHEIQAVQRCFAWGRWDAELLDRNPFARVRRPALGQRRRILSRSTLARMLWRSGPAFRRYLTAMKQTLARPQEIRALCWEHLYWEGMPAGQELALREGRALFVLDDFKARTRRLDPCDVRVIPITAHLGRLLARMARRAGQLSGPIFLNHERQPWTNNAVRCQIRWLRDKLGIEPDHRGEQIVAYTLRHTLATWATAAGVRDRVLADLLGHTSTRTTARYQHLQVPDLVKALQQLNHKSKRL